MMIIRYDNDVIIMAIIMTMTMIMIIMMIIVIDMIRYDGNDDKIYIFFIITIL